MNYFPRYILIAAIIITLKLPFAQYFIAKHAFYSILLCVKRAEGKNVLRHI